MAAGLPLAPTLVPRETPQVFRGSEVGGGVELERNGNAQHDGAISDPNGEVAIAGEDAIEFGGKMVFSSLSIADGEERGVGPVIDDVFDAEMLDEKGGDSHEAILDAFVAEALADDIEAAETEEADETGAGVGDHGAQMFYGRSTSAQTGSVVIGD